MNIAAIRKEYKLKSLLESEVAADAIEQFSIWWKDALDSNIDEVNAMTVATASKEGIPSARVVLLKGFDEHGFVFFTNYHSAKGQEIAENKHASLLFFWKELERQVRINGFLEKIDDTANDEYFKSRPYGSQIGAWSSPQSKVIENRDVLDANVEKYQAQFGNNVPRPTHWGGYILRPKSIEFWQGRTSRLHDRLKYSLEGNNWRIERLAP